MDAATLYDDDIVTWSEQQAEALRRLAAKPELSNLVDWTNIIEEIECLGRSEWRAVESLLIQALAHILKRYCDPDSLSRLAWEIETNTFLRDARRRYRPSMRQALDIDDIWRRAFEGASQELVTYKRRVPPGIPDRSPFPLNDLLEPSFTHETAVRQLYASLDGSH
ncbi:MAG TPA: DUF29 domain-containing protein [Microvirga sp.]|jgi:hypothetical protein|nr:DUF29 domain-containing protein [Microvirga sp.]